MMNMRRLLVRSAAVLAVALLLCSCAPPGPEVEELKAQADQAASNKKVMATFVDLFTTGKWDDLGQVIAGDCVLHYPGGVDIKGLEAMKAGWQVFFGALKDMSVVPLAEMSEGNLLIDFYTFQATYEGDYMGRHVAGVPIKYNQVEMVRIADGKIVEWWVENDRLWMAQQLGFDLAAQ